MAIDFVLSQPTLTERQNNLSPRCFVRNKSTVFG